MNHVEIKRKQIQLCAMALGIVVIWILGRNIQDNGVAYLVAALEAFSLIWILLGQNVPDTMGRLLRNRNAKGQFRNAAKLRKSVFVFQGIMGLLGSVLFAFLATPISEKILQMPYCKFLILLLAPIIFLRSISSVILGSFQGEGSELPSAVSSVLRPLFLLGFGFIFAGILTDYGKKVSMLLGQEAVSSMYGGLGIVIALLLTENLLLLFLALIYKGSSKSRRKKDNDGMRTTDSFFGQVYALYGSMGISILDSLLSFFPFLLGLIFLQKSATNLNSTAGAYGVYVGKYLGICGIFIILISALLLPTAVKTASMQKKEEHRYARIVFQSSMKVILVNTLFLGVLFSVLSKQLAGSISTTMQPVLEKMFLSGSAMIVFGVLAYYSENLLKILGKKFWSIGCMLVSDMIFAVVLAILLRKNQGDIMALVYAGVIAVAVRALLQCGLCSIILRVKLDFLRVLAIPMGSACVVGLVSFLLGKLFTPHLGNFIALVLIWVLTWLLYWIMVLVLRCFQEQELNAIPGGRILKSMGRLLSVF